MGEKKVILDTNILISALGWEGKPKEILQKGIAGEFILILPKRQVEELQIVLAYPRLKFTESQRIRFLDILFEIGTIVETQDKLKMIAHDIYDNALLEAAIKNNISFIVSGDSDLLRVKQVEATKLTTAAQFLELFKLE